MNSVGAIKNILTLTGVTVGIVGLLAVMKIYSVGTEETDKYIMHSRNLWPRGTVEYYQLKDSQGKIIPDQEKVIFRFLKKTRMYDNKEGDATPEIIEYLTKTNNAAQPEQKTTYKLDKDYALNIHRFNEGKEIILEERLRYK
jgi:hypothetical protein